jgi:hypothetical protein
MTIQIPSDLLNQIKLIGEQTRKEIEENMVKITRQNTKIVISRGNESFSINKPTTPIGKTRRR